MIKTKKGDTTIKGTDIEVMADVSIIIRHVYKALSKNYGEVIAKARLEAAFERAFLSKEEIHKEAEACKEFINKFDEILEMIKGSEKDD